jgi:hypothetical protein
MNLFNLRRRRVREVSMQRFRGKLGGLQGTFVFQGSEIVPQDGTTKLRAQKVLFSAYSGWLVNLLEVRAGHARMIDPVLLHRRSD